MTQAITHSCHLYAVITLRLRAVNANCTQTPVCLFYPPIATVFPGDSEGKKISIAKQCVGQG